ncbi:hypothetical protein B0H11DRAFT_2188378 [Mycena galericulata]|nr:hypothetical protein B0H11DRAFT_2188378 [Mycena galericulata]
MLSSRPMQFSDGRMAAKTPGRENVVHRGPMTVHGKGKQNYMAPVQPHSVQPQKSAKDTFSKNPTRLVTRPLVDKTPFPNRDAVSKFNTPLPGGQKIAKLVLLDANKPASASHLHPNDTPDSVARPSSARKHVRAPRGSASKNLNFQTPLVNGNPWDVSELDIVIPAAEEPPAVLEPKDDYDEIEYMPPNSLDTSYTPPFDFSIPDYKAVGARLLDLAHSYHYNDTPPAELDPLEDAYACSMPEFALPALQSDDPFLDAATPMPSRTVTVTSNQPSRVGTSRPGTSTSVSAAKRPATRTQPHPAISVRPAPATQKSQPLLGTSKPLPSTSGLRRAPISAASKATVSPAPVKAATSRTRVPVTLRRGASTAGKPLLGARGRVATIQKRPAAPVGEFEPVVPLVGPVDEEDFLFDV